MTDIMYHTERGESGIMIYDRDRFFGIIGCIGAEPGQNPLDQDEVYLATIDADGQSVPILVDGALCETVRLRWDQAIEQINASLIANGHLPITRQNLIDATRTDTVS